jgi:signal transduction histidine kinase
MSEPATLADRTPLVAELFHAGDLQRAFSHFSPWGVASMVVVCAQRQIATFIGNDIGPIQEAWLGLFAHLGPAKDGGRELGRNKIASLNLDVAPLGEINVIVRPLRASGDTVARVVYVRTSEQSTATFDSCVDAVHRSLESLTHAAYAQWVSGEAHRMVVERNAVVRAEVERAVTHIRGIDRLRSDFLATVSHELRTPLTSIIGYSEMLLRGIAGDLSAEQHECVAAIFERGEELQCLISQMLDMTRISDKGVLVVTPEPRDLGELSARAVRTIQWAAGQADVALLNEIRVGEFPIVMADPARTQQIFVNLLNNAVKFSPAGTAVRIAAELAPRRRPSGDLAHFGDEERDAVMVSITDEGGGIPPEEREKIFEAFYQVDGSATRRHGGVGLGLSIVRKLVEAHGGDVWVEGEPGRGARFCFTFPLAASA